MFRTALPTEAAPGTVRVAGVLVCLPGLAGLAFALWPTFTIVIGSTSSAALPGMLAPWAVLPLMVYTFGLAVAMPAIQVGALGLFPDNRGLASSMLSFIQMMAFALVSGLVAPLLFGSAFKLACGVAVGLAASFAACRLGYALARGRAVAA